MHLLRCWQVTSHKCLPVEEITTASLKYYPNSLKTLKIMVLIVSLTFVKRNTTNTLERQQIIFILTFSLENFTWRRAYRTKRATGRQFFCRILLRFLTTWTFGVCITKFLPRSSTSYNWFKWKKNEWVKIKLKKQEFVNNTKWKKPVKIILKEILDSYLIPTRSTGINSHLSYWGYKFKRNTI